MSNAFNIIWDSYCAFSSVYALAKLKKRRLYVNWSQWCPLIINLTALNKLIWEKGDVLIKHSLAGESISLVLLNLFINGKERCHITDAH